MRSDRKLVLTRICTVPGGRSALISIPNLYNLNFVQLEIYLTIFLKELDVKLLQCIEHCFDFIFLRQYRGPEVIRAGYLAETRAWDYANPSALQQFERVKDIRLLALRSCRLNRLRRQLEAREHVHRTHRRIRLKKKKRL